MSDDSENTQTPLRDPQSRNKILEFLKSRAPFSVIERGIQADEQSLVADCGRTGSKISGTVKESEDITHIVNFNILSTQEIGCTCTCASAEEIQEQWCFHAVALLWRAHDLGFFEASRGFASDESTYRMNTSSPQEIAAVITELCQPEKNLVSESAFVPEVELHLESSGDRLGVQVRFNQEIQTPAIFEGLRRRSQRALDNILIQILDDQGSWDEQKQLWYVNDSQSIETVLGLMQEYPRVLAFDSENQAITFSTKMVLARLGIEWLDTAVELVMSWVLPDGSIAPKNGELLGTGPYWVVVNNVLYKVAPTACRIASIFPYSSTISLTRSQAAPLLESITANLIDPNLIEVINPHLQPETEVKQPVPSLSLERREQTSEHFSNRDQVEVYATLEFEYPTPTANRNLVYLPDREKEREYSDVIKSLGFESSTQRKRYVLRGDAALDLINNGTDLLPAPWRVDGLEALKKSFKFVDLTFNVNMSSAAQRTGKAAAEDGPIDWFDCHVSLIQNNANVPISMLFKHHRADEDRWIRLDSGAYARVPGGSLQQLKTTFGMLDSNFKLSNSIKARLTTAQALSFTMIDDPQFNIALDQKLKKIAKKLEDFSSITKIKPTKGFKGDLRAYQEDGLSWLNFLQQMDLGGILADEMGLGKTVQTLALIEYLKENRKASSKPTLVIAPTSVITNWVYEAKRFAPKLKVLLLHGSQRKSQFAQISEHDIVITSYALLRLDRFDLEKHEFNYLILDEAQNIKNPETATTRAAKSLRAERRLALTGTPTENRPMELWSIMDFLMPGYLGSYDFFRNSIERPILEVGPNVKVAKILNTKTKPFILRRRKNEVEKDLPPKTESVLYVPMTDSQRQLYARILDEVRPKVLDAIDQKGVAGASISILAALLRLRQVCNHPYSIEALKEVPGYDSGKFNLLKELVTEALESGRKILLFSQFREMLAIIRSWLNEISANYLYLDGATKNRQELIDRFNNDNDVRLFLISLKAGGTGLNLTAADTVIIYDPWWNPAVESQAVDRAHRIGQTKPVTVYRLVTEDSVEKKIMELKAKKAQIVEALIGNDNGISVVNLSKSDLETLFSPFAVTD